MLVVSTFDFVVILIFNVAKTTKCEAESHEIFKYRPRVYPNSKTVYCAVLRCCYRHLFVSFFKSLQMIDVNTRARDLISLPFVV